MKCTMSSRFMWFSLTMYTPHRPVSEYDVLKCMNELARLLVDTMCERRLDMSGDEPSERSQLPKIDWSTSMG